MIPAMAALGLFGFLNSGGIDLLRREFDSNPNNNPNLAEWLPVLLDTAASGGTGALGGGLLPTAAKILVPQLGGFGARIASSQFNTNGNVGLPSGYTSIQAPQQYGPTGYPTASTYGNAPTPGYGTSISTGGYPTGGTAINPTGNYPTTPVYPTQPLPVLPNNNQFGNGYNGAPNDYSQFISGQSAPVYPTQPVNPYLNNG